jgi:hypothetical protein
VRPVPQIRKQNHPRTYSAGPLIPGAPPISEIFGQICLTPAHHAQSILHIPTTTTTTEETSRRNRIYEPPIGIRPHRC